MQTYQCDQCGESEYVSDRVSQVLHVHGDGPTRHAYVLRLTRWQEDWGQATDATRKGAWLLVEHGSAEGDEA